MTIEANDPIAAAAGALIGNTTGANNTANGIDALNANTTGNNNVANGSGGQFPLSSRQQ